MRDSREKKLNAAPAAKQPADLTRPAGFVLKKKEERNKIISLTVIFNESVARVEG